VDEFIESIRELDVRAAVGRASASGRQAAPHALMGGAVNGVDLE
jgi:hypothetical protein